MTFGEKDRACLLFAVLEGTPQAVDYFIERSAVDYVRGYKRAEALAILERHIKVREITPLFGGRVIAMEIPWTKPAAVKGLIFESGQIQTVGMDGEEQALQGLQAQSR